MHIFSLAKDEALVLANDVVVRVTEIADDEVRLEIDRPESVPVVRGESRRTPEFAAALERR